MIDQIKHLRFIMWTHRWLLLVVLVALGIVVRMRERGAGQNNARMIFRYSWMLDLN